MLPNARVRRLGVGSSLAATSHPRLAQGATLQGATVLAWILRAGVALTFLGHGAFGLITKQAWLPYFAVAGIPATWGWRLMPWVGAMDVAMAFLALLWPCRALF